MYPNSQIRHPGRSKTEIRDPGASMTCWIVNNGCAVSGMTMTSACFLFPVWISIFLPRAGQIFPLTRCMPWSACFQDGKGYQQTLEQAELTEKLLDQSTVNADQLGLEDAISQMEGDKEIRINVEYAGRMNSTLPHLTLSIDPPELPGCPARLP